MSWYSELFGDQSKAFDRYGQELDEAAGRFDPSVERGEQAAQMTWEQYQRLMNDPNFIQDQVARGYEVSPYQKMLLDKTQQRMSYNAAQQGMLGSGGQQRALQENLLGMSGQFLNDYINRGMQSYGMGLQGAAGLNQLGLDALGRQTDLMKEGAAGRLQAERSRSAWMGNMLGGFAGAGMAGAGMLMGGPEGAKIGYQAGSGMFGGGQPSYGTGSTYDVGRQ